MMNSVAPVWDGNETWLVLGGMGLLAVFPLAFAIIMPALYFPLLLMLLGLIFRGVAFEFRLKDDEPSPLVGPRRSSAARSSRRSSQGVVLGMFVAGLRGDGRAFRRHELRLARGRSRCSTGVGLLFGYALLGATWLVMKTEGDAAGVGARMARLALYGVLAFIAMVSIWTPLRTADRASAGSAVPNICYFALVPVITAVHRVGAGARCDAVPTTCRSLARWASSRCAISGSASACFPTSSRTVHAVAGGGGAHAQTFLLIGTLFLLPIIFMYIGWSYYVFRGKVTARRRLPLNHPST